MYRSIKDAIVCPISLGPRALRHPRQPAHTNLDTDTTGHPKPTRATGTLIYRGVVTKVGTEGRSHGAGTPVYDPYLI